MSSVDFNLANLFTPASWTVCMLGRKVCLNDPWYCNSKISSWKLFRLNFICVYKYIYVCVCELVFTEGCNDFILIIPSFNSCLCNFKFSNYELLFYLIVALFYPFKTTSSLQRSAFESFPLR